MVKKNWQKVNRGDTACIVATSYGEAKTSDVDSALNKALSIVESYGLKPFIYKGAIVPGNHSLFDEIHLRFANSEEMAVTQLMNAFNDQNCDVVWAYRGGYGAIRLLNNLAKEAEPTTVKPFIGFSDITILHSFINNVWEWPTIHFGMPGSLQNVMQREDTKQSLQNILFGDKVTASFSLKLLNEVSSDSVVINGVTTGGNMYNVEKLLGTKFSPNLENRILVLEEIDEAPRKVDGFFQKLQLMPDFENISAVVIGTFTPDGNKALFERIFKDFSSKTNIPVFSLDESNTIGHGNVNNAFPLGTNAVISFVGESFRIDIESGIKTGSDTCDF